MKHTTFNRAVLALLTLAMVLPVHAGAFSVEHRYVRCRFESLDGHVGWTGWEVRSTIACAVARFPVPGGFGDALYIASRESGLYPKAVSSTGCCKGIYQHSDCCWASRVASFRAEHPYYRITANVFNARSNVLVALWLAQKQHGWCPAWC